MMAEPKTFAFTNGGLQGASVAYAAGANPTQTEFNALIDALVAAGVLAPNSED